ncbi:NXPE family member 3-like isoform X3 [Amblyraja radiata]|uniref:NXPE family member 3-like isoform X3 n=1 Tax=Amblyraja radiata TaxID=386614 RepID=UPI0014026836|nr:NXPE family member 3-like isoform X3 [Amblyraja radiata]
MYTGVRGNSNMDEQATRKNTKVGRFLIVALLALALVFLNMQHIKQFSISGAKSVWIRYPAPKNYSTLLQEVKMPKTEWIHKLMQYGYQNHSFTLEERTEGTVLMKMIEWPMPPDPIVPFRKSSDPLHTCFIILNSEKTFHVGDQLQVMLRMFDFDGNPKQYGGDYLQARIHTPELKAGSAGTVIDNQNGYYYINFTLSWPGKVQVSLSLIHPSEGIEVLKRLREERSDRVYLKSTFKAGAISKTTVCNLILTPTKPLCNFTDLRTGEPWFCYKPENLPCSTRINHAVGGYLTDILIGEERLFFQSKVNIKKPILPCAMGYIIVEPSPQPTTVLDECVQGKPMLSPSGFYYKDQWMSLTCNIRRFNTPAKVTECLRRKKVHLFGDSTLRQWFEYLTKFVPGIRWFDLGNPIKAGPLCALDMQNNIMLEYCAHGPPIQFTTLSSQHLYYISNKLNEIKGGKDTVICIAICAHFCSFPVEVYIRRLQHIRRSVLHLLSRNPDTVVVIKTANVRALTQDVILNYSDWFSFQLDLLMRRMFAGINVAFVDAWEMTMAHYLPHNIHPPQVIIKNEIDVFLSHVCPSEKR